jgi:outer membrane receptor protein involved in Fe transport
MNLYKRAMRGWDFNVGYQVQTERLGTFFFRGTQSLILENKTQFSLTAPVFDGVNYPLDTTTGGSLKRQSNVSLNWEAGPWTAGISSRFLSAYRAYGSAGGPLSLQSAGGANSGTYATAQGNNGWIPAQDIHDVLLGYRFGRQDRGDPSRVPSWRYAFFDGLSVTLGVKNVFDTAPEYDVGPFGLGFFSPFVDVRMREYWISVRRSF